MQVADLERVYPRAGRNEDLSLPRAVVDVDAVAVGQVVRRATHDGSRHLHQQALRGFAHVPSSDLPGAKTLGALENLHIRVDDRPEHELPVAVVTDDAGDPHAAMIVELGAIANGDVDPCRAVLDGKTLIERGRGKPAGRNRHRALHGHQGARLRGPRLGDGDRGGLSRAQGEHGSQEEADQPKTPATGAPPWPHPKNNSAQSSMASSWPSMS